MKKIKLFAFALAVASFGFTSCNDDDDDVVTAPNDYGIAGTYNLSAVNTGNPTDFNQDGTESDNQMDESDCYDGGKITLNADGTFEYVMKTILVNTSTGGSACDDFTAHGTWTLDSGSGTSAIIDATYEAENGDDVNITLNKTGNQLQLYSLFAAYPDRNGDGGAIYTVGELELLFTK